MYTFLKPFFLIMFIPFCTLKFYFFLVLMLENFPETKVEPKLVAMPCTAFLGVHNIE